jgi:hypothetical protein
MPILRARVLANKPPAWGANLQIGVSTNFDKLCGCVLQVLGPSVPHYTPLYLITPLCTCLHSSDHELPAQL